MKFIKIILPIVIIIFFFNNTIISSAQTAYSIDNFAPIDFDIECIEIPFDLRMGSRDYALFGNVMKLQLFLYQNEMMYYPPTGYFGEITQASLAKYQSLRSIVPTGVLDFATRNTLAKETCGVSHLTPPSYYNYNGSSGSQISTPPSSQPPKSQIIDLNDFFGGGSNYDYSEEEINIYDISGSFFSN